MFIIFNIFAEKKYNTDLRHKQFNCSEKQQILKNKMQGASNLRIKKLYGSSATQN